MLVEEFVEAPCQRQPQRLEIEGLDAVDQIGIDAQDEGHRAAGHPWHQVRRAHRKAGQDQSQILGWPFGVCVVF